MNILSEIKPDFVTDNFYLSVYLMTSGYNVLRLEQDKTDMKKKWIIFEDRMGSIQNSVIKYHTTSPQVPLHPYEANLRRLKSMIHGYASKK